MTRYLLDTALVSADLRGRPGAVALVDPWVVAGKATTSILVYGEVVEYLQGLAAPNFAGPIGLLRGLMRQLQPLPLTYTVLERYAELRRLLRPPHGPGLISDTDTLIAATALEHGLQLVTTDGDYVRVPCLMVQCVTRAQLR